MGEHKKIRVCRREKVLEEITEHPTHDLEGAWFVAEAALYIRKAYKVFGEEGITSGHVAHTLP